MKLYFIICFIIVATEARSANEGAELPKSDVRDLRVYTEYDQTGSYYEFTDYVPNLDEQGMDDALSSFCGSGFWIFYSDLLYGGVLVADVPGLERCENFGDNFTNQASSIRYAGSPFGLNDNYYNLYEMDYYRDDELRGNDDLDSLNGLSGIGSLIITGQSAWTFYSGEAQTGQAVCLYPTTISKSPDGTVMKYSAFPSVSELGLPGNTINSLARGCLSDRIVGTPPSDLGEA